MAISFTTPVARIVGGDPYDLKAKLDDTGAQKMTRDGKPAREVFFSAAIRKGPEKHWKETSWGAQIWAEGEQQSRGRHLTPTFSWKIFDGDSDVPGASGRRPCDNENFRGHWVLRLSSTYLPKFFEPDGKGSWRESPPETRLCRPGNYVEIRVSCQYNGATGTTIPGVYLNPDMIAYRAPGPEIVVKVDPSAAGFGAAPLPPGVTDDAPPIGADDDKPQPQQPRQTVVVPDRGFVDRAAGRTPPPPPPRVPQQPMVRMLPKAAGASLSDFIDSGWTVEDVVAQGYGEYSDDDIPF